jgi:hypothetical protein
MVPPQDRYLEGVVALGTSAALTKSIEEISTIMFRDSEAL